MVSRDVERLVAAIREFGLPEELEEPRVLGGWSDAVVWFGSLALLGPARARGVGAFASVALVSRTWARRHYRFEERVSVVVRAALDLLGEDLEDRAALVDAVEEESQRLGEVDARVRAIEQAIEQAVDEIGVAPVEAETAVVPPEVFARAVEVERRRVADLAAAYGLSRFEQAAAFLDALEAAPVTAGVVLADDEADALHAAVMGDAFDGAVMDRALAKVREAHERRLNTEALDVVDDARVVAAQPAGPPEEVRAAGWTCGGCGQGNAAWSSECGRCGEAKTRGQ